MDVDGIIVAGHLEVLTMHRFLFESKGEDFSSGYAGSPYIAAVQHRLADALEEADPGSGWTRWRAAEKHESRIDAVRRHLSAAGDWWAGASEEIREAYVRDLLAPLRLPAALLEELVGIGHA